jgi:hypothetical protein
MAELAGTWTHRSFNPEYVRGNQTLHPLILADDLVLTLRTAPDPNGLEGTIEWEGGGLVLNGTIVPPGTNFDIVGIGRPDSTGRPGTGTDGWEYRYSGHMTQRYPCKAPQWTAGWLAPFIPLSR